MRILVTGGAGFIGSHFVEYALSQGDEVNVLDKLTYAGREENLARVRDKIHFFQGGIESPSWPVLAARNSDAIVNFAAETHVDNSIRDAAPFIDTNVRGTHNLLEFVRARQLRYVQVSTDEVYGSIDQGSFTEESPLGPSSPYSASKTAGDLLVQAYRHTYGIDSVIVRGSNNYGPRQFPEKLIPLLIQRALANKPLPIYGDGRQVRNWIHVQDFVRGVYQVLGLGTAGEVYNCGGDSECDNLHIASHILHHCRGTSSSIQHVEDRLGHDRRYSLDSSKLKSLGWKPEIDFDRGLYTTVRSYRNRHTPLTLRSAA